MVIESIDDLLQWVYDKSLIATSKCTTDIEKRLIDKAVQYQLLYSSSAHSYKLTDFGFDVVESGITWTNYREYYQTKENANKLGISNNSLNNLLAVSSMKSFDNIKKNVRAVETPKTKYGRIDGKFGALPSVPIHDNIFKARKAISGFLQHWFVEKYVKPIIYFFIAAAITYYMKGVLDFYFP